MIAAAAQPAISECPSGAEVIVSLNALETYCLDEWIEKHQEPRPSRAEAIRRLMRMGLCEHPGQ